MKIKDNSVILPLPSIEFIRTEKSMWGTILPESYVQFIQCANATTKQEVFEMLDDIATQLLKGGLQ